MEVGADRVEIQGEARMGSVISVEFARPKKTAEETAREEQEASLVAFITIIRATIDSYATLAGWSAAAEFLGVEQARAEYMKEHKGA